MTTPATVKRIRVRGGLTQEELGRLLLVTSQTISNWESGRAKPGVYEGAVLLRLLVLSRRADFSGTLVSMRLAGGALLRDVRTGRYTRAYDLLRRAFGGLE